MRRLLTIAAVALLCAAGAAAAIADDTTIRSDLQLGSFHTRGPQLLTTAVDAFGAPSSAKGIPGDECRAVWRDLGLVIAFLDLERSGRPCAKGSFLRATMIGRAWHTATGLRIGDPVARLRRLFPHADLHRGDDAGWWLVTRHNCPEVGGEAYAGLLARTSRGRVSAFVVRISVCE